MKKTHAIPSAVRTGIFLLAAVMLFLAMSAIASSGQAERVQSDAYTNGRVVEVLTRDEQFYGADGTLRDLTLTFTADIGDRIVTATQIISDGVIAGDRREVEPGSEILMMNNAPDDAEPNYIFTSYVRTDALLGLGIIFVLALILFGRSRGLLTLITLGLTCATVFGCFIPAVLAGKNIYLWTLLVCAYITVFTLLLIGSGNRKSIAAMLGCMGGTLTAALVMAVANCFLHMTGFLDDNTAFLLYLNTPKPIDLQALLYAAILIGALGAVMDVAVDIASALAEIAAQG